MSAAFRCRVAVGDGSREVAIEGSVVTVDGVRRDVGSPWLAVAVFEANVDSNRIVAQQPERPAQSGVIDLPYAKASLEAGRLVVDLAECDPISYEDSLVPRHRKLDALGAFDPATPPPNGVLARHVLRRLSARGSVDLDLRLSLDERFVDPVLADVRRFDLGATIRRLQLGQLVSWDGGSSLFEPFVLAELMPNLEQLLLPGWAWSSVEGGVFHRLEELTLSRSVPEPRFEVAPMAAIVERVARACPALHALRVECQIDEACVEAITHHRLPQRLQHLDLRQAIATTDRAMYEALLTRRSRLDDIDRITLQPPHRDALRERLLQWGSVVVLDPA